MVKLLREWYMWDRQLSISTGSMLAARNSSSKSLSI